MNEDNALVDDVDEFDEDNTMATLERHVAMWLMKTLMSENI